MRAAKSAAQSRRFLLLYALASAGGAVAYVPFLTLLLPVRVTAMVGERDVTVLAYIAFAGAIAASVGHIAFGWASDLTRTRRPWILAGLASSCALLLSVSNVTSPLALGLVIVAWQVALNMMLAPLAAWAGDCVPDDQKGTLGGLLALCPALGALSGTLVTLPGLAGPDARLALVAGLVAALVLPAVIVGNPRPMPQLLVPRAADDKPDPASRRAVAVMWLARLLVQIAEAALFAYILFWLRGIDPGFGENRVATVFGLVLAGSVPLTMVIGIWSDRNRRPLLPLAGAAAIAAIGLVAMAMAGTLTAALAGYVVFGLASSAFLALHTAQTLRVLPRPQTRGRDLGFFNLTNTVPSLVMPWLALGLVPGFGFSGLFLLLGALALAASALLVALMRL